MTLIMTCWVLLVVALSIMYIRRQRRLLLLPPGPRGLPLLGNFVQLLRNPHLKLSNWTAQYGKLYTIKYGTKDVLVVSDVKHMKELFSHPASTGKFKTDTVLQVSKGLYGIVNTDGVESHEQRLFCMRTLVHHGISKKASMEPLTLSEITEAVEYFKEESSKNNSVSFQTPLKLAVQNIIWTVVSGERILSTNPISKLMVEMIAAMDYTVKTGLVFIPGLKYIAPKMTGYTELDRASNALHSFIKTCYEEHTESRSVGKPRNVFDSYLEQMESQGNNPNSSFYGPKGMKHSVAAIVELFMAGGESISDTINWLILYLCRHPDIQAKLHEEVDTVIGRNREPSLMDRPDMPYTQAVIYETLRKSSLVFSGLIHELIQDVDMFGYKLPKGMLLLANLYHVHHDPVIWKDPENFRPERFLFKNKSRIELIKNENLVPFQVGKRQCLGEHLAKDVLFLFVTKLFQSFQILPNPDNPELNLDPHVWLLLVSQPFTVKLKLRGVN